jgi:uncharacterized membrane protein (UPF0182 family)
VLGAKIALAVIFTAVFFVAMWGNLVLADRLAPRFPPPGPEEDAIRQYREAIGGRIGLVRIGVSLAFAMIAGIGVSGQWNQWILFRNSVDFGTVDPLHGRDIGFYVFRLPFLSFVVDWAFAGLIIVLLATTVAHYLNGGIRFQTTRERVTPQVKVHLSVLLGVLALLRTADYWLQRFELNFSSRGFVHGASYTDVEAQLPALNLLVWISVEAASLFLVNIRLRGWVMPVIAVGLWAFVSLVVATIYPAFIQRFRVEPAESDREAPYIARNIDATRAGFDLADVDVRDFDFNEDLTAEDLEQNEGTIRNIRLWEPAILARTYQRLQEVRGFYRFNDVDVDRYIIDGQPTQVVLSARELKPEGLPTQSWENEVLAYTHGYGLVLSPANSVTRDGQPDFLVKDVPPSGEPVVDQPAIYYGEKLPSYAVVGTSRDEIDFPAEGGLQQSRYDGSGGVSMSSFVRRAAFALRFGDINPLISNFVSNDSRILFHRDILTRVENAAPFLSYDADPYPVIIDGRIMWIIDAYTTTNEYPYSQEADTSRLEAESGLRHGFNYVRNSVKVVIDAYHGSMRFYVIDPTDPIVMAYRKAFPELFTSGDEVSDELRAHFRYPEDLFRVQTNMWGRYHIGDPIEFFSQSDGWNVAQDPGSGRITGGVATSEQIVENGVVVGSREARMDPYYLLMKLPGERAEEFLALQPFVPTSEDDTRKELSAFMVARSDPEHFGKLVVFVMPRNRQIDGPSIVDGRIQQAPDVSQLVTLLNESGSRVLQGNLLVIPIEGSLLYIRPLYVEAQATQVPELKKVVVVFGDAVVMRNTFEEALTDLFAGRTTPDPSLLDPLTGEVPDVSVGPDLSGTVLELLQQADALFAEADAALARGDLGTYQSKNDEAAALVAEALRQSGSAGSDSGGDGSGTTTSTSEPADSA